MKTEIMLHCGNAPKMEKVIELTISLAKKDINMVKSCVREDFVWMTVGKEEAVSLYDLTQVLAKRPSVTELIVDNALSHGKSAMCEGTLSFEDGSHLYFCNVVKFVNASKDALIKEAHTYFIK